MRAGRRRCFQLLLAEGMGRGGIVGELLSLADKNQVPVRWIERDRLESLEGANHQGVVLEAEAYRYSDLADALARAEKDEEPPLLLILDHLQDAGNLGSLLRSAEAAGVHGVILPERRAVGVTPAVCHTSSGATEHLVVAMVANITRTVESLKTQGIWVVGLHTGKGAQSYDQANLSGALALVVGAEGQGLSRLVRERCDFLIGLSQWGKVASLNAAVAGAVALYEARRQRSNKEE